MRKYFVIPDIDGRILIMEQTPFTRMGEIYAECRTPYAANHIAELLNQEQESRTNETTLPKLS